MANNSNRNIAAEIADAIASGASPEKVAALNKERDEKIAANKAHYDSIGVSKDDSYGKAANTYVNSGGSAPVDFGSGNYSGTVKGSSGGSSKSSSSPSTSSLNGNRILKNGANGTDVSALQSALNSLGYNLSVDGKYGSKTQAAVSDYQKKNGLGVDGIVGVQTYSSLNNALAKLNAGKAQTGNTQPVQAAAQGSQGSYINPLSMVNGTAQELYADWTAKYEQQYKPALDAALNANQAGVQLSVKQIEATLENGLSQYSKDAEEAYLNMLKAERNTRQQSAYNGDLGGIGQKQYSDTEASYDAALLSIALEREAFINSCNQQIDQLQAQGRLQDAQLLAEWAQSKLQTYAQMMQQATNVALQEQQMVNSQANTDREFNYNRAVTLLERGMLTADAVAALGVDEASARAYADQINETAKVSLAYAKAQLEQLQRKAAGSSGSSGGSGGSGGAGGGTPASETGYTDNYTGQLFFYRPGGTDENGKTSYVADSVDMKDGEVVGGLPLEDGCYYDDEYGIRWVFSDVRGEFIRESEYNRLKNAPASAEPGGGESTDSTDSTGKYLLDWLNTYNKQFGQNMVTTAGLRGYIKTQMRGIDSSIKQLNDRIAKLSSAVAYERRQGLTTSPNITEMRRLRSQVSEQKRLYETYARAMDSYPGYPG